MANATTTIAPRIRFKMWVGREVTEVTDDIVNEDSLSFEALGLLLWIVRHPKGVWADLADLADELEAAGRWNPDLYDALDELATVGCIRMVDTSDPSRL